MNPALRLALCLALALLFGGGKMLIDKQRNAEWVVSPQQIAEARAQGKIGVTTRPGTVAVAPIRSEKADALPFSWAVFGLSGALVGFLLTRRRPPAA